MQPGITHRTRINASENSQNQQLNDTYLMPLFIRKI